jgi:hypothetical protein
MSNLLCNACCWTASDRRPTIDKELWCRCTHTGRSFLVNLRQNASFTQNLAKYVPTLMTGSSWIWSMVHKRCLCPLEHLVVMGLDVFGLGEQAPTQEMPGILFLATSGNLKDTDIAHAAGNGMVQISVGTVLMFGLGAFRVTTQIGETSDSDPEI